MMTLPHCIFTAPQQAQTAQWFSGLFLRTATPMVIALLVAISTRWIQSGIRVKATATPLMKISTLETLNTIVFGALTSEGEITVISSTFNGQISEMLLPLVTLAPIR